MRIATNVEVRRIKVSQAAGTGTITSDSIDMQGYEGVAILTVLGAVVAGAATSVKLQQSSDDGVSDAYADLTGTSITIADSDDDLIALQDIWQPRERYVRAVVSRATQNSEVDAIIALLYRPKTAPVTQPTASVLDTESYESPAEGTA